MAGYFEQQRQFAAKSLGSTADLHVKKERMVQLLCYDTNARAASDTEHYLDTGEWIRTRTMFDDYNFQRMAIISAEKAAAAREPKGITNGIMHQIDLLPFSTREKASAKDSAHIKRPVPDEEQALAEN